MIIADATLASEDHDEDPSEVLDEVVAAAPEEMSMRVRALVDEARATATTGGNLSDESADTLNSVYEYMAANCDVALVSVVARDYSYINLPGTMERGPTVLELVNDGTEMHEMAVVRFEDEVGESVDDLVQLSEEEALEKVSYVTFVSASPGASGFSSAELSPGRYGVLCFLPQGETPEATRTAQTGGAGPEGQPHALLGMTGEFRVV